VCWPQARQPERIKQVLDLVYFRKEMVDADLVASIRGPAQDPQASEVFYLVQQTQQPIVYLESLFSQLKVRLPGSRRAGGSCAGPLSDQMGRDWRAASPVERHITRVSSHRCGDGGCPPMRLSVTHAHQGDPPACDDLRTCLHSVALWCSCAARQPSLLHVRCARPCCRCCWGCVARAAPSGPPHAPKQIHKCISSATHCSHLHSITVSGAEHCTPAPPVLNTTACSHPSAGGRSLICR
jgi:hypothetical protein